MHRPTKDPHARPAIATLERLHMELGGKLLDNRQMAQELAEQMPHIEACIKMLDPTYNLARITVKRRKANGWFKRGTLYRRALDVLRTAEQPLTATDIAWKMLEAADRKDASKTDAQVVAQGILRSLIGRNGKGVQNVAEGKPAKWKLTEAANSGGLISCLVIRLSVEPYQQGGRIRPLSASCDASRSPSRTRQPWPGSSPLVLANAQGC